MITLNRFHEILLELKAEVNSLVNPGNWTLQNGLWIDSGKWEDNGAWLDAPEYGKVIDELVVSPTETHLVKKIGDKRGIILGVKMPDADTELISSDNYSDNNHCLFFLIEKIDPGKHDDFIERWHYSKMQNIMKLIKDWLLQRGLNGKVCGGDETISKPFHTEWEYQIFGGFNGLSISFDLKDFSL